MKDIWKESLDFGKKINKKKIIIAVVIFIIVLINIALMIIYNVNKPVREWIDVNIFRKEIMQNNVTTIELKENLNAKFIIYGNTGGKEKELDIQISDPLWSSSNRFLAIAEKNGKKLYVLEDKDIIWEDEIDGNIAQIYINKNGYVALIITDTSYKSVVKMYNPQGKQLFTTFLSATRAIDVSVSNDNKYLAIAEVDTSGTIVQSSIRVMSIEKATSDPTNSLENTYKAQENKLITCIKYQDKNKLLCRYTDSIDEIVNGEATTLMDNQNKKVTFQSIDLTNYACSVEEKSSGLFTADSVVNIINTDNGQIKEYTAESVTKELYTSGSIIALNLGTEIEFINTGGWLVKRYKANQEITKIVVSESIAGIIYRDKVEIVNL